MNQSLIKLISPFKSWFVVDTRILGIFRFFLGLLSLYYLNKKHIVLFIVLWVISNIGDSVDGALARKYNKESNLGKNLDIISDTILIVLLLYILIKNFLVDYYINTMPSLIILI